jgi:tRNA-specific 2-thiouridylase
MERVSFVAGAPSRDDFSTHIRIRHRATPVPGSVSRRGEGWTVRLDTPTWAPAPGQAAVFYNGDEVVGGGRIASA